MPGRSAAQLIACLVAAAGSTRADLPPGFTRTAIWLTPGGISVIEPLSGGRVLAGALYGPITLLEPGQPPRHLINLPNVVTTHEHGLLGMTADPDFDSNGYFYVLYTGPGPYNLVARYTLANNAVDPGSRVVIWQNPGLCPGASHQGGAISFGLDQHLYIATGDQFDVPANAQNLSNQHGKILRLASDGSVPPDNPFVNTPGAQGAIWCYGLRNPFRFTIDRVTGSLWISDVGDGAYEEISRGSAGANYGWPFMEGTWCSVANCSAYTLPVVAYPHGDPVFTPTGEAAVIGGPIYRGSAFPVEYRGNLFYADHVNGWIKRAVFDAGGSVAQNLVFDSAPSAKLIVDFKLGPDGALFYAIIQDNDITLAGVYKIAATQGGNLAPVVAAAATPTQGEPPLTIRFKSGGTIDPDNGPQPLAYSWAFGDGSSSTSPSPSHEYTARGRYQAVLTVTDGLDPVSSDPIPITVGHAPVPVITAPAPGFEYSAGDTIHFSGMAWDLDGGRLAPAAFTWSFALVHLNHVHPFLSPVTGVQGGSFVIPSFGHDPEHTHYRIDLLVRDSDGITTAVSRDLVPRESELSLTTLPPGIPLFLDGRALATPSEYESLVGYHHQISAQPSFVLNGIQYQFQEWSNGQPATFEFISPEGGLSLVASYVSACYANCDGSAMGPILTGNDFICFLGRWAAADPYANCDGSTMAPILNANDFQCFLNSFASGCS